MKRNGSKSFLLAATLATAIGVGFEFDAKTLAQTATPTPASSPSGVPVEVEELNQAVAINFMHSMNVREITQAINVSERLQTFEALVYSESLIAEHEELERQVLELALAKDIFVHPFQPSTSDVTAESQMQAAEDEDLDPVFFEVQRQNHLSSLQKLQDLGATLRDPEIHALVMETIPVIQNHLNLAISQTGVTPSASPIPSVTPFPSSTPSPIPSPTPSPTSTGVANG